MPKKRVEEHLLATIEAIGSQHGIERPGFEQTSTLQRLMDWLELLQKRVGEEPIGLLLASRVSLAAFGELGLSMRASENLGAALERLIRFHRTQTPLVDLTLYQKAGGVQLQLRYHLPERPCTPSIIEGGLALLVNVGRLVCGVRWSPELVFLPHETKHKQQLEHFFGAALQPGPIAGLLLSDQVMALKTTSPDPAVTEVLDALTQEQLQSQPEPPLSARLHRWLRVHAEQAPRASEAAKAMAMSRRTLCRHLRREGTSFQQLLDQTRQEVTQQLLDAGCTVGELAFRLGFADTSSFCRTYRRWYGHSPGARPSRETAANTLLHSHKKDP